MLNIIDVPFVVEEFGIAVEAIPLLLIFFYEVAPTFLLGFFAEVNFVQVVRHVDLVQRFRDFMLLYRIRIVYCLPQVDLLFAKLNFL